MNHTFLDLGKSYSYLIENHNLLYVCDLFFLFAIVAHILTVPIQHYQNIRGGGAFK
jgi:hypothetical protein